jgi:hypothetical protein
LNYFYATVENGHFIITYTKGKGDEIPVREIPNYSVVIALLKKLGKRRG